MLLSLGGLAAAGIEAELRQAARLDEAGRCAEAEKIYQRLLALPEREVAVLNNSGNHYLACGDVAKARQYFEQLLRLDPEHRNGALQLARISLDEKNYSVAVSLLEKAAARHAADFPVLFLLGVALGRAGQAERARHTLEAALRLRPDDLAAMVEAGLASAAAGDLPRAVFLLARAQARAPTQPRIALALARACDDAGYYGDAVLAYDRYLTLQPSDHEAARDRARALALTHSRQREGIELLRQWTERHPGDALGHFYLAQLIWRDDPEAALARLDQAIVLNPRLASAHLARAWLLHRLGRDADALPHLEAALAESPNDVRVLNQLGRVLASLDRIREAEVVLRKAAVLNPNDAEIALHLGRVLMDQGLESEGQRWLDAYQRLRSQRQRDARRDAGMIELATLDPASRRVREIDRYRAMARSRPDDPLLQLHLANLLLSDGQTSEAISAYQRLAELNADANIWRQAGRALIDSGHYEVAQPFLERAGSYLEWAEALLQVHRPRQALQALDATAPHHRTTDFHLLAARIFDALNEPGQSAAHLKEVLAAGELTAPQVRHAALLLTKQDQIARALELVKQSLAAAPADRNLLLTEAILHALNGDSTVALARLRRLEARWPEWPDLWLAHGLLLAETGKIREAKLRRQAAIALGALPEALACASLRAWAMDQCAR